MKDPEAHRLALAIAQATGQSLTRVVTEALRARYDELQHRASRASLEELSGLAQRIASHVKEPLTPHGELLYDQDGLPR